MKQAGQKRVQSLFGLWQHRRPIFFLSSDCLVEICCEDLSGNLAFFLKELSDMKSFRAALAQNGTHQVPRS